MKIVNSMGLPQPLVDAVTYDDYTKGDADFSVTQLSKPPLQQRLMAEYGGEVEVEAAEQIWALFGTAVHEILERAVKGQEEREEGVEAEYIAETRKVSIFDEWMISGKQDIYVPSQKRIIDYKVTSVFAVMDGCKPEWVQQLNILAALHRRNGQEVENLSVVAILRDWSKAKARRGELPFKFPVAILDAPVWTQEQVEAHVLERCTLHQQALDVVDPIEIPPCTANEMWARPDKWAVIKKGNKRAARVLNSEDEANHYLATLITKDAKKAGLYNIIHRPGERIRCNDYCPVSKWCWVNQEYKS